MVGIGLPVIIASKFSWADMRFHTENSINMIQLSVDTKSHEFRNLTVPHFPEVDKSEYLIVLENDYTCKNLMSRIVLKYARNLYFVVSFHCSFKLSILEHTYVATGSRHCQ